MGNSFQVNRSAPTACNARKSPIVSLVTIEATLFARHAVPPVIKAAYPMLRPPHPSEMVYYRELNVFKRPLVSTTG